MYLGIDVGGTKTLLGVFSGKGKLVESLKFLTPKEYDLFLAELATAITQLKNDDFQAAAIAIPGKVDRKHGIGLDFGNLPWEDVAVQAPLERLLHCPVLVENDANLAGLSEAMNIKKDFKRVLYVTISTGIGTGIITNGIIDPDFADSEGGHIVLDHHGKFVTWESFGSGKAIVKRYGKKASEIDDPEIWKTIAHDWASGFLNLIAVMQPDVVVIGGGVGSHFDKFGAFLVEELHRYETPLTPTPPILAAQRPEEAVIYGCYELLKEKYGPTPR